MVENDSGVYTRSVPRIVPGIYRSTATNGANSSPQCTVEDGRISGRKWLPWAHNNNIATIIIIILLPQRPNTLASSVTRLWLHCPLLDLQGRSAKAAGHTTLPPSSVVRWAG